MQDQPCGLMALVARSVSDYHLHGNPHRSIYSTETTRTTWTSWTFRTVDFADFRAVLSDCDLVGECFLSFKVVDTSHRCPTAWLTSCSICVETQGESPSNEHLETVTGKTIDIFAQAFEKYRPVQDHHRRHIMLPLPFAFCHATESYLPIVQPSDSDPVCRYVVTATMDPEAVTDLKLVYKAVYLDTCERRGFQREPQQRLMIRSRTLRFERPTSFFSVDLPDEHHVKDIAILIQNGKGLPATYDIERIDVEFNGHLHMSLDNMMLTQVVPRTMYNTSHKAAVYIPFCQDPLNLRHQHTSQVDLSRLSHASLLVCMSSQGPYVVTVVIRSYDVMQVNEGLCAWTHREGRLLGS